METTRTVPPEGSLDSKIAFVGEAPAFNEIAEGRPFIGRAGQQFNDFLLHSRITRREVYITNLFKVQITKRKVKSAEGYYSGATLLYSDKEGFTDAGMVWVNQLHEELKDGSFNLVVPMGNPAMCSLIGRTGITKRRGSVYHSDKIGKKVMPTIHPAATLRNYLFKHFIISDFRRAREQSEFPELRLKERDYILKPNYLETLALLDNLQDEQTFAYDLEVIRGEVQCISFSTKPESAFTIPFYHKGQLYFNLEQEAEIWKRIGVVLEDESIRKVGQYFSFDTTFLFEKYGIITRNLDDTKIAHLMTFPDYPAGLDFLCSMYTDLAYYKDEGKQYMKWGGSDDDLLLYCCKDSIVCIETMPQLEEDLKRIGNYEHYRQQLEYLHPVSYMGLRGMRMDIEGMEKYKEKLEKEIEEKQAGLNEIVGTELNAGSHKQIATYFYITKGLTPYRKDGKITVNEGALKRIARKGYPEAQIILRIRSMKHTISHYIDIKFHNGRLRCSYDPAKKTGRFGTSREIISGYGTNMQNFPAQMDKFYIADEGTLLYNVDLSQADNRSVAYIAPEPRMIKAFEDGTDVHSLTASFIFNIPPDEIKQMNEEKVKSELGYGDQTHRYWGKKANHSLNFGMGYKTFAYDLEIPESEGKMITEKYHTMYPGVRKNYHTWVRDQLSKNRMLTNAFGRKYLFLDRWSESLFNQAYAFIPQSNTADIINRFGITPLYYNQDKFRDVELLRQVHDSINFQIPVSIGLKEHTRILKDLKEILEVEIEWKAYKFTIPVDFKVGFSLNPMTKLDMEGDLDKQLIQHVLPCLKTMKV